VHVGIRAELFRQRGNADAHDLWIFQCGFGIRLEGTEFSLPAEAEVERGVEYSRGIQRKA
jgi:hypothetical protein